MADAHVPAARWVVSPGLGVGPLSFGMHEEAGRVWTLEAFVAHFHDA